MHVTLVCQLESKGCPGKDVICLHVQLSLYDYSMVKLVKIVKEMYTQVCHREIKVLIWSTLYAYVQYGYINSVG